MADQGRRTRGKRPMEDQSAESQPELSEANQAPSLMRAMEQFLCTFQGIAQTMHQQAQGQGGCAAPRGNQDGDQLGCRGMQLMEKFRRLDPPAFKGEGKPEVVKS